MYCPKCGTADQNIESYCRSCGLFLPDFDSDKNRPVSPVAHWKINLTLSFMTAIGSAILVVLLHMNFTGREGTSALIYATIGFLTAVLAWQIQVIWRNFLLRKHLPEDRSKQKKGNPHALPESTLERNAAENFKAKDTAKIPVARKS
jgi:hypothetical protein